MYYLDSLPQYAPPLLSCIIMHYVHDTSINKRLKILVSMHVLKGISAEFQVIRGFSQKIPADLLSYDKIHS